MPRNLMVIYAKSLGRQGSSYLLFKQNYAKNPCPMDFGSYSQYTEKLNFHNISQFHLN